jgi:hypothetical protein
MKIFTLDALFEFSPGGGKSTCGPAPIVSVARTLSEVTKEIELAQCIARMVGARQAHRRIGASWHLTVHSAGGSRSGLTVSRQMDRRDHSPHFRQTRTAIRPGV